MNDPSRRVAPKLCVGAQELSLRTHDVENQRQAQVASDLRANSECLALRGDGLSELRATPVKTGLTNGYCLKFTSLGDKRLLDCVKRAVRLLRAMSDPGMNPYGEANSLTPRRASEAGCQRKAFAGITTIDSGDDPTGNSLTASTRKRALEL